MRKTTLHQKNVITVLLFFLLYSKNVHFDKKKHSKKSGIHQVFVYRSSFLSLFWLNVTSVRKNMPVHFMVKYYLGI